MSDTSNYQLSTVNSQLIPSGYKQTEVGVIPEEWDVKSLADVGHFRTGPFGTLLKADEYYASEGTPLVSVRDIGEGVLTFDEHTPLVPPAVVRRLPQYVLNSGDIVFGRKGGVERSAMVQDSQAGCFLGSDGIRIRPSKACISLFLTYQLQRDEIRSWLLQNATGTTMASMNQGILRRVSLPFPRETEQSAIAEALSDADALLGGLERLIAKKRDLKQAAMQQLLTGQTRLPGFQGEWEVKRMGSVLRFQVGFPFSSKFFNEKEQGIRLVKNRDLKSDDQVFYYSDKYDPVFLVHNGDVLVGMDGDFLPCLWAKGPALLNQRVGRIVPLSGLNRIFSFYYLLEPLKEIEVATASTTVKHLSHGDIEDIQKPLPTFEEQKAIAEVLSDMDTELTALEQRWEKARALKQAMMQELLTGRTRLPVAETAE